MSDVPLESQAAEAASDLCTRCGLCCDGTVFDRLDLTPGEAAFAAQAGVKLQFDGDRAHAPLRCDFLRGSTCSIYLSRYSRCRSFRCMLLRGLDAGSVTPDTAHMVVAEAMRLREHALTAAAAMGAPALSFAVRKEAEGWREREDPSDRRVAARAHMAFVALELFLTKHFRVGQSAATRPAPLAVAPQDR